MVFHFIRLAIVLVLMLGLFGLAVYSLVLPQIFQVAKPLNLIIVSQDLEQSEAVVFAHISPQTSKTILAVLNGTDRVEVLGGYGQYSIQSLYTLLRLDGKDDHFVRAAFSHALGVMVDEVILVDGLTQERARSEHLSKLIEPLVWQQDSSVLLRERLELYFAAQTYRSNEIRPSEAREIAPLLGTHPLISEKLARQCQVAVVNTTTTPGLATGVGQLLEKSGAFVIRVASDSQEKEKTSFVVRDMASCAEIVQRASQLFPYVPEVIVSEELPLQYRADLVILAGKDLSETAQVE